MNMVTADDLVDDEEYDGKIYWPLFLVAFIKTILRWQQETKTVTPC